MEPQIPIELPINFSDLALKMLAALATPLGYAAGIFICIKVSLWGIKKIADAFGWELPEEQKPYKKKKYNNYKSKNSYKKNNYKKTTTRRKQPSINSLIKKHPELRNYLYNNYSYKSTYYKKYRSN
jgi:hypothetical protein